LQHLLDTPEHVGLWEAVETRYTLLLENLVQALRGFVLGLSACFIAVVLRGGTVYPKWFAFCAPIIPLILIFASYFLVPAIGKFLLPAAMNVAHFVVFGVSLLSGKSKPEDRY